MLTIERAIRNEGKCKYFYNMIVGNKNFSNRVVLDLSRTAGLCTTFAFKGKYLSTYVSAYLCKDISRYIMNDTVVFFDLFIFTK